MSRIKEKFPFLANLMLADNDFHYVDEHGKRTDQKVDAQEILKKVRERRKETNEKGLNLPGDNEQHINGM